MRLTQCDRPVAAGALAGEGLGRKDLIRLERSSVSTGWGRGTVGAVGRIREAGEEKRDELCQAGRAGSLASRWPGTPTACQADEPTEARARLAALAPVCPTRRAPGAAPGSSLRELGMTHAARRRLPMAASATCSRPGRPLDRRVRALVAATLVAATALLNGCDRQEPILSDEPFRLIEPDNAELLDETVDDGSSLIKDGERSVRRRFAPIPPAEPADVLDALVAEGEASGWAVVDRSASLVVARKEVDGRQWVGSVAIDGGHVRQTLAGR